jgi:hypothetical protein
MAANLISVTGVAGQNNVVYPSAITMAFPATGIIATTLPADVVIGATTCKTEITVIATNTKYYTSTEVGTIIPSSTFTGSLKYAFSSAIAAINANALPATQVIGFPSLGVIVEPITSRVFGSTTCRSKITVLATNTVYFTNDLVATIVALTV